MPFQNGRMPEIHFSKVIPLFQLETFYYCSFLKDYQRYLLQILNICLVQFLIWIKALQKESNCLILFALSYALLILTNSW
jgi:hypothetical protein